MRKDNTWDEKEKAFKIRSWFKDFDGGLNKWEDAFYQLWRTQLTFDFAYELRLGETHDGVYVSAIVKQKFKQDIETTMIAHGYRELEIEEVNVGIVYALERDDMDGEGIECLHVALY